MAAGQKSNTLVNPLAAQAMEKFKYEVAQELGIQVPQSGYWGEMTTRDTGAVGGHMVRKMIEAYENSLAGQNNQQY
ncbi:MAG TPA: alpha/beta-type small acid-soluble spore protein [Halanaerobiales bacterium]|nr:alpha/beta-type small acid-soluble spore protein [Halanaerobiales bacterium]